MCVQAKIDRQIDMNRADEWIKKKNEVQMSDKKLENIFIIHRSNDYKDKPG